MEETLENLREVTAKKSSLADRIDKFLADKQVFKTEKPGDKNPAPSPQLSST